MTQNTKRRLPILICTVLLLVSMLTAIFASVLTGATGGSLGDSPAINKYDGDLKVDMSQYYDGTVIQKLPSEIKDTDDISLIIQIGGVSLLDVYEDMNTTQSFSEFYLTDEAASLRADALDGILENAGKLSERGIEYSTGAIYNTIFNGFELIVKAGDFLDVCKTLGDDVNVIVGEVYKPAETKLVENKVNAFETGIFDTTGFSHDGTGMVVAVLDTGTDYYHSAFSTSNFTAPEEKWGLTYKKLESIINNKNLAAEGLASGLTQSQVVELLKNPDHSKDLFAGSLTADDVYISGKLPYGYDYADRDSDVFPINNHHGTHVAGIIAGKDDTITGVAPNAQIATMKIFSDTESSARTSWILSALEDCVALGVDVINMSIGTACGFSRETDKEQISGVYDRIREQGINMVVAASNSFNSAYSSEKNGNLPLTSNPDSATVGSPSTYEGAMSVASIEGAKTFYILFGETIIYFEESTNRVSEEKEFVKELLGDRSEAEIEYVLIPGAGLEADYTGIDVTGKVALIKRGSNTFEEKANIAEKKGAAAAIIYNNVSGDIKMNVGDTSIPVCSISQNDGELLAATSTGKIKVSKSQSAGPFMSDFSSWGPTPELGIKPEITAHGGSILSAVPGQDYDRISGTSMATPNISGVTTLLRQFVIEKFYGGRTDLTNEEKREVAAKINRLMMSTADIVYNKNGNPYAVRKQGAGLANLVNCANTNAYILTYRADGSVMDKSKIELGDDPAKKGVYTLVFTVDNFGTTSLSYDVSALVMTEGVSETKTNQGDTTVTETAYMLGAGVAITKVEGGSYSGNKVTVAGGSKATVTMTITLTDADKKYLDESFANGMYVEGFVTLDAEGETVDLSVPYLAFYGDWTKAPIFDLDFYATNKDELDDGIDLFDKTLADAFPTRPIGGTYDDYVSYLGSYYYEQAPGSKKIAADRKYISLTNQGEGVNSLEYVWAGLLRNVDYVEITIVEDSTGEVVFETVDRDIRKSYGDGGPIRPANIDIGFSAIDENLKNNTKYTVTLKAHMPYGDGGEANNLNNTFTFPLTIDFEAPTVTGCEFYTEYDKYEDKTRLFAKVAVYDNHYSMAMFPGYIGMDSAGEGATFYNFDRYLTPIYSEENSTTYVTYELTDYIDDIKKGTVEAFNKNTFSVMLYDYALNISTYEITLPDEYVDMYFEESQITLSPNEIYTLKPILYPGSEWAELVDYKVIGNNTDSISVVNGKVVAIKPGTSVVRASANGKTAMLTVKVLSESDDGYRVIDKKPTESFRLTGYYVDKAFYFLSSEERDIGETENIMKFLGDNYSLKMFPSEKITLQWEENFYFPNTTVVFESGDPTKAKVDPKTGTVEIISNEEGYVSVTATVMLDGNPTYYSATLNIEIKDPWVTSGPSLANYYGLGKLVVFPKNLAVTSIGQYAFSNYKYIPKTENDEISDEVPEATKITYIGDNTIEEVIIPEGVESIGPFAFANLTELKSVTIPSSCTTIDYGAFYGCSKLKTVKGIENVKFINRSAFQGCTIGGALDLKSAIAIGDYAFADLTVLNPNATDYSNMYVTYRNAFTSLTLSESCKSVGAYAFASNHQLAALNIKSDFLKLGAYAFSDSKKLTAVSINAAVIPTGTFYGCTALESVTIGKDVNQIGEYAFGRTKVSSFTVAEGNSTFAQVTNANALYSKDGTQLMLAAPTLDKLTLPTSVTSIAYGAFSGNTAIKSVDAPGVTWVGGYAFADCSSLESVVLGSKVAYIGDYAFANTDITALPDISELDEIGKYAFTRTAITSIVIPDGMIIGEGAFSYCKSLASVKIGNGVTVGDYAFRSAGDYSSTPVQVAGEFYYYYPVVGSNLKELSIGDGVTVGNYAFWFSTELTDITVGSGTSIGDYAFYGSTKLTNVNGLSKVIAIGKAAFSGDVYYASVPMENQYGGIDYVDATDAFGNPIYIYNSPLFTSIDLSACEVLGDDAFGYCKSLVSVTLGDKLTAIPVGAFRDCDKLATINLGKISEIGEYAFTKSALTSIDLTSATKVGNYAFCESNALASVVFSDKIVEICEGAFSYCPALASVTALENVMTVGDYSFAYTALTSANLSGATYVGTHAFMKEHLTPFAVVLGDKLENIGDNPFVYCKLERFSSTTTESFNGKDYTTVIYDFNLSDNVRVIDGSLYRVVPRGLELVVYCPDPDTKTVRVADNTVRISAYAFAGSDVVNVIMPYTLEAVGHKAFYGCEDLAIVNFSSYYAPILEEEYDFYYFYSGENLPISPDYLDRVGEGCEALGIVDYFVWNVNSDPTSTFYGASFKDYIGKINKKSVMVKPANGVGYDSFIMGQYFDVVLEGANAADDTTLAAIDAISKLPEKITLADKPLVVAARALYNKIATYEQRALVDGVIQRLLDAENRIADLEYLEGSGEQPEEPTPEEEKFPVWAIVLIAVGGSLIVLGGISVGAYFLIKYVKRKKEAGDLNSPIVRWLAGFIKDGAAPTEEITEAEADEAPTEEIAEVEADEAPTEEIAEADAEDAPTEEITENSEEISEDEEN